MLKALVIHPPQSKNWDLGDIWHICNAEIKKCQHTHKKVRVKDLLWSANLGVYVAVFELPAVLSPGVRAKERVHR